MKNKTEHLSDGSCWCKPVCVFNAGNSYGRVWVHTDSDTLQAEDPGAEMMMVAIFKALYDGQEIHIKDYPEELIYEHDDNGSQAAC